MNQQINQPVSQPPMGQPVEKSSSKVGYIIGIIILVIIAIIALWYFSANKPATTGTENLSGSNVNGDLSTDLNQATADSATLDNDEAASAASVNAF